MKINNIAVVGRNFAYDNCHKIYIIEDEQDLKEAKKIGYDIYSIVDIKDAYENSCPLRFISDWKLKKNYVGQFDNAIFDMNGKIYEINYDEADL